ncbi:MAG: hypothetical protein LC672_05630, partial [Acidobacteria bacterium]|nr:hypothetical protein [Acidobacteriota bacterium]
MTGLLSQTLVFNLSLWQQSESLIHRVWRYVNHKFTVGNFEVSLASLVIGLAVFIAAVIVSRSARAFMERRMAGRARLDPGIQYTILRLVHYLVI